MLPIYGHDIKSCTVVDQLRGLHSAETALKSCAGLTLICTQIVVRRRQGVRVRLTLVENSVKYPDTTCLTFAVEGYRKGCV